MPIYEYQAVDPRKSCPKCLNSFEVLQGLGEKPLTTCPECANSVRKLISWCHSAIVETSEDALRVEKKIKEYEGEGMWSHAAELADKHSEKTKDKSLKLRALDNYKKAGYDTDSLAKHANLEGD
ncbi:MAG: zinc ribbon domain-containing protein [Deltaproteobacteria bacterium]|nr:zinc ribbon domain-containing protein [Deltaproteobacteria bacterium]